MERLAYDIRSMAASPMKPVRYVRRLHDPFNVAGRAQRGTPLRDRRLRDWSGSVRHFAFASLRSQRKSLDFGTITASAFGTITTSDEN